METEKTILFYTNQTPALEFLTRFAKQHQFRLTRADDIADVFACTYDAAVIQRDLLDEPLFSFLKEVYMDEIPEGLKYMEAEVQWEFEDTLIVFGDGQEISDSFKRFFIEISALDESTLLPLLHVEKCL